MALFLYFTNSNPAAPVPSSCSFLDTRRLLPLQGKRRAIMGALQEPVGLKSVDSGRRLLDGSSPDLLHPGQGALQKWARGPGGLEKEDEFFSQPGRAFYTDVDDEDDFLAAAQPGPRRHTQATWESLFPQDQGLRPEVWPRGRRKKTLWEVDDDEQLSSSMSRALLRRLWKGNVSSKMLAPRLQQAMRDYLSTNKHGVRFRGRRAAARSRAQLLCQLRGRVRVRTLDGTEAPFAALGWRHLVPAVPLSRLHPHGLRSCAVVMSAGAILNSSLGPEIGGCSGGELFTGLTLSSFLPSVELSFMQSPGVWALFVESLCQLVVTPSCISLPSVLQPWASIWQKCQGKHALRTLESRVLSPGRVFSFHFPCSFRFHQ